jgi:iron complex outermembrane receptor protein
MKTLTILGKSVLLLNLVLVAAHAQEPSREQEQEKEEQKQETEPVSPPRFMEQVYVEGRIPNRPDNSETWAKSSIPLASTPASVSVVPEVIIETQEARILSDALKNVSGVNVATGFGVFDYFVIRGFDSLDTGLVLTDGAFEPDSTFYQLYNTQQVEVLKGPTAFLYGANPLSGTVNLVRKQPLAAKFANFKLSYGSFNTYRGVADLNVATPDGRVAFRLNGLYQGSDFYRDDKKNDLGAINPSLMVLLNEKTPLTVNFEYVDNEFEPDTGLPLVNNQIPDVSRKRSYQSPLDVSDQKIYRLRVDFDTEVSPNFTLRNKFYYTDLDWQSDGTLLAGTFPDPFGSVQVVRSMTLLDDRRKSLGNQLEGMFSFSTGSVEHNLMTGFEARRLTDVFTLDVAALPLIDLYSPVETTAEPLFIIPGQSTAADSRAVNLGLYFVDQLRVSEKLQFFLGARWDRLDYDDEVTETARDDNEISPMLGLVISPRPDLSFYANYGRAFAPPSSRVVGERKPEESRQIEVGVKKDLPQLKGLATVAYYDVERNDIGIPDANGFTQQTGNQRSRGIELELAVDVYRGWLTSVSYAYNDSELTSFSELVFTGAQPPFFVFDRSGNVAPFAPKHLFNLWTTGEVARGFRVGGGARHVSRQYIAPDNAFAIEGYVTLDAMVSYGRKGWLLKVNFRNLTNRDYETRGFGNSAVIPADPFAVYANIEFSLGS